MIEISHTKEIKEKLKLEGKVEVMDKPEHIKAIEEMNKIMENVHRDYLNKNAGSIRGAANCWVYQQDSYY